MDPNLFHLDWERTFEVLATVVVLAILVERALSILFEHRVWIDKFRGRGFKEAVAFAVAFIICWRWNFDAISMIVLTEETTRVGEAVTAGVIAGGAKGSIRLFRDVLEFRSNAYEDYLSARSNRSAPPPPLPSTPPPRSEDPANRQG